MGGHHSFFIICYWKTLNKQKSTDSIFPWKFLSNYLMFHFLTFDQKAANYIPANPRSTKIWMSRNLCIYKNVIFDNVWILSENHQKAFQMFSMSIMRKPQQPSTTYWAIWLVDFWPVMLLVKIYQFDSSSLYFLIENSSDKSTKSTSCFIIFFDILKIMKLMKKFGKRSWEICWKTWRLPGKQEELAGMNLSLEGGNNNL